jgi:prepilin-type N-terminal cleavage/methylation domain-containing protein
MKNKTLSCKPQWDTPRGVPFTSHWSSDGGGFTLVEILIVVVILGITAMMVIPMIGSAGQMQLRSAVNMISADMEYAKSLAISRGQTFSVVFNESNESYSIKDKDGNVILHPVKKGFDYVVEFGKERLDRVNIATARFDTTNTVKFDYLGSPWNGNNTELNSGIITLQADGTTVTVSVEPVTGFISASN